MTTAEIHVLQTLTHLRLWYPAAWKWIIEDQLSRELTELFEKAPPDATELDECAACGIVRDNHDVQDPLVKIQVDIPGKPVAWKEKP